LSKTWIKDKSGPHWLKYGGKNVPVAWSGTWIQHGAVHHLGLEYIASTVGPRPEAVFAPIGMWLSGLLPRRKGG
jgi:hypothetical protein